MMMMMKMIMKKNGTGKCYNSRAKFIVIKMQINANNKTDQFNRDFKIDKNKNNSKQSKPVTVLQKKILIKS